MNQPGTWRLISVAVILGAGIATIWGFGLAALIPLFETHGPVDFEELVVDTEGTPYVKVRIRGEYENLEFRTLDGQRVELSDDNTFYPTLMSGPYRAPRFAEYPIVWRNRIAGVSGVEKPPVSWVMLRDGNRPGKVYFVGHNPKSNELVGYIGRKGFRTPVPPRTEQFDMGNLTFEYDSNPYASTGAISDGFLGGRYNGTGFTEDNVLQPWLIYLRDGDAIQEINLQTRGVRLVKEIEHLVGIAVPSPAELDRRGRRVQRPESRLLVRTDKHLVLVDAFTGTEQRFVIPEEVKGKVLGINTFGSEQLLLHVDRGKWERGIVTELLTINSSGDVQQRTTVELLWGNPQISPYFALIPACIVPVLLGWLGGIFLVAPLVQLQNLDVATFSAGVRTAWDTAWLGLILVFVLSVILTMIVYRWQKRYSRPNTGLWTTFVFLTTLPGFLAYWAAHRREPMGSCQHCGANIPLDRDICAECAALLPEPKLLGTEIFA